MTGRPVDVVKQALAARGCRGRGSSWQCPAHDDRRASLSISEGRDGRALLKCHAGCTLEDIVAALGLEERDLFPDEPRREREIVAVYDYTDEEGNILFQVVRYHPKDFRQRRPDGRGGWVYNLKGVRRVLYNLPRVREVAEAGGTIFITEGEKDADRLERHLLDGADPLERRVLAVTTNPGGAGKWRSDYSEVLRGARVVVVADRDEPGRRHAREVAQSLEGVVERVTVLEPPAPHKDVSDLLAAGGRVENLVGLPDEGAGERDQRSRLLTAADLLAEADGEEPDWLVDDLLPRGGLSVLAARPKAGKSTLSRALGLSVAQGRPFLGRAVRQGPVLLVSLEDRRRDVARHLASLGLRPEDPILVATEADGLGEVEAWVREHRPVLVVVDTLARLMHLRDIADYAELTSKLDGVLRLARDSGAHVMLLHHAPKGSDARDAVDAPLGSTAIGGSVDVALHMKRAPDGTRTLASIQRMGEDLPESVLVIGEDGWPQLAGTRRDLQRREAEDAIVAYLTDHEGATRAEVLEAVEGRTEAIVAALGSLLEAGLVRREGTGRRGDPYRYTLGNGEQGTESVPEGVSAGHRPRDSVPAPRERNGTGGTAGTPGTTGTGNPATPQDSVPCSHPYVGTREQETPPEAISAGHRPRNSVPPSEAPSGTTGTGIVRPEQLEGEEREALERLIATLGATPEEA